jgi:mannan endo-1,4-beta-mannosidase
MKRILTFIALCVISQTSFSQIKVEAESGVLTGTQVENSFPGFSGRGYITGFDNEKDAVTIDVTVDSAGGYNLSFGFSGRNGEKIQDVFVNDIYNGAQNFPAKTEFSEILFGKIILNAGLNTIKAQKNGGWTDIDYTFYGAIGPMYFRAATTTAVWI